MRGDAGRGHVLRLEDCTRAGPELVGGKAVGLGFLVQEGLRVPPGFAVTTGAYREFLEATGLRGEIRRMLDPARGPDRLREVSERVRSLFEAVELDPVVAGEVARAYERLAGTGDLPVAVRSSATAEDTGEASFAGQQESYLWVRGRAEVARGIVRCWGSLFSPQAISYRARLGIPFDTVAMGVVVQAMVDAEAAGVMMTIDPVTGDPSQIAIEASHGLGVAVVGGEVTPDRYFVDKVTLDLRSRAIMPKQIAYRFDPAAGEVRCVEVAPDRQAVPSLTDEEAVELARIGKCLERALCGPQDVEWAIGPGPSGPREAFLLQTRPETVWSRRPRAPVATGGSLMERVLAVMTTPVRLAEAPREGET